MKKIMGHLTGKLSLSILSVIVLLVGVLAGQNITSMKAGGKSPSATSRSSQNGVASAVQASSKVQASLNKVSTAPVVTKVSADKKPAESITKEVARDAMNKLPLLIEPNQGQADSQVKFVARSMGYQVYMTGAGSAVLEYRADEQDMKTTDFITMKLAGANTAAAAQPLEPTGGVSNYYLGSDPAKWVTHVPHYAKLRYGNVYPGIDMIYQGDRSHFRYDFQVNPGADPKAIQIAYEGGKGVSLEKDGSAVVDLGSGRMIASKPVIFQEYGGQKHTVDGNYVLTAANTVSFQIGAYDKSKALVIDPSDTYAAYVGPGNKGGTSSGATFNTVLNGVGVDPSGPVMAGWTANLGWAKATAGIVGIAVKMDINLSATTAVSWITVIGSSTPTGSSFTVVNGIADSAGTSYLVGATNAGSGWPTKSPLEASPSNANVHAFVASLSSGGSLQAPSSMLSGSGTEFATAVAVDVNGALHITGGTTSGTSTQTPGPSTLLLNLGVAAATPFQANQSSSSASFNAFYLATNAAKSAVAYGTLFGGYGTDWGNAIAVDTAACATGKSICPNAYIAGASNSFGAGTVVGIVGANELTEGPEGVVNTALTHQFSFTTPKGSGCPANPPIVFDLPTPPADFFGTPTPAQGTAIVNNTVVAPAAANEQVFGITITNPGAGYDPLNQSNISYRIFGCSGGIITGSAIVQNVPGGESANNLPIPGDTISLTNPGTFYNPAAPPLVTITGGSCIVEPTATAIVSTTPPFGLTQVVLNTPGAGCTVAPTITIQAPPTVAGTATGQTATASYTQGTANIGISPSGTDPANYHGFVAKFNPSLTGANSLSYAIALGNTLAVTHPAGATGVFTTPGTGSCLVSPPGVPAGPGNSTQIPPPPQSTVAVITPGNVPSLPTTAGATIGECEIATSIAVDQYGNAYVGGNTLIPNPVATTAPPPVSHPQGAGGDPPATPGIYNGNSTNVLFTSPGTAGGELNSITVTSAGSGYGISTTRGVFFDWTHDINGQCYIYPSATATTDASGGILNITITNPGFGCTSIPGVGIEAGGTGFAGFATMGTAIAGNPDLTDLATGFVLEILSNQPINNGPVTTNTQDGIPLGHDFPSSVAGWPAMVYATFIGGDEACSPCVWTPGTTTPTPIAGGFGNGSGTTATPPATAYFDSIVTGVAVDALGQAYVSGAVANGETPGANGPGTGVLMLRRRINAKGFPSNPFLIGTPPNAMGPAEGTALPQHSCDATCASNISTPNSEFLSDFPVPPNTGPANVNPNTGITPFGSVIVGAAGGGNAGSFQSVGFDPGTLTACWAGFIENALPAADASATGIFPSGAASQPAVLGTSYTVTAPTATGLVACTQFVNDIVVGGTGGAGNPTPTSLVFTMPAGTTPTLANGSVNPQFPTPLTINGTLDSSSPTGANVVLGTIAQLYYQGKDFDDPGFGPDTGAADDVQWLIATPLGSSVRLSLNPDVTTGATNGPGAPFLDPGIYYCLITMTPTLSAGAADNANIPQTVLVTLNVTGLAQINTAAFGGQPAPGTDATGKNINLSLQQGTAGSAAWDFSVGGVPDAVGNAVLNIPVVAAVPLNAPSNSHMVFLLNQGTLSNPLPMNSNAAFPIVGTGLNSADADVFALTGFNIPIGGTKGGVFLTPADAVIETPSGDATNDVNYLPTGTLDCSPRFVNPPDTRDDLSKSGANKTVCYIQVILPPTILQGAPPSGGPYVATLNFQSVPNLTDPETPVRNDESHPYLDTVPGSSTSTASPYVENICAGSDCASINGTSAQPGYDAVPSPFPTASLTITITPKAGPLIINSPWISNTTTNCLTAPAVGPGPFFGVPVCNTNGPVIPLAPFTVPSAYTGVVTSNINSFSQGNNPQNTYNNVVLDSRNLGLTSPGTFSATAVGGLQPVTIGTTVTAQQVANDFMIYQFFPVPTFYPVWDVPTCTLNTTDPTLPGYTQPLPLSMLTINGSPATAAVTGTLPASNATVTTTAFTIGVSNPSSLANGFYSATITVVPNGDASREAELPVCVEIGNNIITEFETIPQPTTVPPPFDPTGNIVPADGLVITSGNTQYVQIIINTLGPNQIAPLNAGPTFGTPSFVAVPVTITPDASNPSWVSSIVAPPNMGNEFSISLLGSITEGTATASNCSLVTGAANGPCLTDAYMDFVIANAQSGTAATAIKFDIAATGGGLLAATDAPSPSFTVSLPVFVPGGPTLVYNPAPTTTNNVVAYIALIPANSFTGGVGYTTTPNVTFGPANACAQLPVAQAQVTNPGVAGVVSAIYLTNPGSGCTFAPTVTIDAPLTANGITAAAQAFLSNGVLNYTFDQMVNTPPTAASSCTGTHTSSDACSGPSFQAITVKASQHGLGVLNPVAGGFAPTIYYNPPATGFSGTIGAWLTVTSVNCNPTIPYPAYQLNECEFTLSTNSNVTVLQQGTYTAIVDFLGTGPVNTNVQPNVVTALVTLNITALPAVQSSLPTGAATFSYVLGSSTGTNPASQTTELSVNGLPSGTSSIPVTVTPAVVTGPAGWLLISLNGSAPGPGGVNGNLTTAGIPLVISVNPSGFTAVGTYNGSITVSTPSGSTSTPTITIPVTVTVTGTPSVQFSDSTDATASCATGGGNESCTATAAFTIGQTNAAPPAFTTVLTLLGSTADTLNITSNVPWLTPSASSTQNASTALTISINPANITPLQPGPIVGVITAKGVNGPEVATFTVTLTVANPPTITMTAIPASVLTFGEAPFTVTTNVSLSSAPANPTTLPVSCTVTRGGTWLAANTGNPASLSATAAAFNFTITPANVTTGFNGQITCTTTGGITPAITANINVPINGSLITSPADGTTNALQATPYIIGQPVPTMPLSITSLPSGATATIVSSANWLTTSQPTAITPATASGNGTVQISINPNDPAIAAAAASGTPLSGTITVSVPNSFINCVAPVSGVCSSVITYTLGVQAETKLAANPTSLEFDVPTGFSPQSKQIAVTDNPVVSVPVTATTAVVTPIGGTWLTASGGNTPFNSTVTVTGAALAPAQYAGSVAYSSTLADSTGTKNIPIVLNVGQLTVNGQTSGVAVTFNHQFGVTAPVTSNLTVSAGLAAINWVTAVTPNAGTANCNWLVGPTAGAGTTPGAGGSNTVTVSYNPAQLPNTNNATYACTIAFSPAASYGAPAADTVNVVVTLNATSNPVFQVTPNSTQTIYVLAGASSVPGATFQVAMSQILAPNTTVTATVTPFANNPLGTGPSPTPIFSANPTTLTVPAAPNSVPLVINANVAGLPVGTYQGSFTISSTATPSTAVVTVDLVVQRQCQFTVVPTGPIALPNAVPPSGAPVSVPGSFTVTPSGTCQPTDSWTASSNASWLIITSGGSGGGTTVGTGTYLALSNPTTFARTATVTFTPSVGVLSVIQFTQPASTAPTLNRQVTALYQSMLGRDPDAGGYAFWIGGGTAGLGIMADDFLTSPESFNTNMAVMAAYQAATGAPPTYAEFTATVSSIRLGTQTIAGLFTSLSAATTGYSSSNLYMNLLGRAPGAGDAACVATGLTQCFQTIIGYSNATTPSPYSVANNEFQSTGTFANHTGSCTNLAQNPCTVPGDHTNALYIRMLYFTILGRDPDSGGMQFWLGVANSGGAGILFQGATESAVRLQILGPGTPGQGFIGSAEFQALYQ